MDKIQQDFFLDADVVKTARELLGKVLVTNLDGLGVTKGRITETEAYAGITDKASHAYGGRRTKRTETMYLNGGVAYVYLCYGMHHLFNIVVGPENIPNAVLIRGIEPLQGIEAMSTRTGKQVLSNAVISGPGKVSKALGITTKLDKTPLLDDLIWLENGPVYPNENIVTSKRIGIDYAAEDALLPYKFLLQKDGVRN